MKRRIIFIIVSMAGVFLIWALCDSYISPVDVLTGKERVVAEHQLPSGDRIQVLQYWNNGDFYNLNLRHLTAAGVHYDCVIDPDCLRVPRCDISVNLTEGKADIEASHDIRASYRYGVKELIRGNGVVVRAEAVR
jgi:hypothetical protein